MKYAPKPGVNRGLAESHAEMRRGTEGTAGSVQCDVRRKYQSTAVALLCLVVSEFPGYYRGSTHIKKGNS